MEGSADGVADRRADKLDLGPSGEKVDLSLEHLKARSEREKRHYKYRMVLTYVLACIVGSSVLVVSLHGVLLNWPEPTLHFAFDIVKMSLTGLLGYLVGVQNVNDQ